MKKLLLILLLSAATPAMAQLTAPTITATTKGPDQINLTWSASSNPGYGYHIEIQSAGDSRYSSFTEVAPWKTASGYTASGGACAASDVSGAYVYNPQDNRIPTWVVEANYIDPQDGTAAQYMMFGLKPNVSYSFRVRTSSGIPASSFSAYSNTSSATTSNYTQRFISTTGNDANGGTNSGADAWLTFSHASSVVTSGTIVLVEAGSYANDDIFLTNAGASGVGNKIVYEADAGAAVTITSPSGGSGNASMFIFQPYTVIDGINVIAATSADYALQAGNSTHHDAIVNLTVGPTTNLANSFNAGLTLAGTDHMLVYGNYFHDGGTPCAAQNPNGDSGFILTENPSNNDVIAFNHITRGSHDTGLCKGVDAGHQCQNNRWLNNIHDGGWGLGWEDVFNSQLNLMEGDIVAFVAQLEAGIYKPSLEISGATTTLRRNIIIKPASYGIEFSNLNSINIPNSKAYNNVIYNVAGSGVCFWFNSAITSASLVFANNICTATTNTSSLAFSFTADTTDSVVNNSLLYFNNGTPSPSTPGVNWNINSGGSCSASPFCTVAQADSLVSPPWSSNASFAVVAQFANAGSYDFHLLSSSPLISVGAAVTDATWGSFSANKNLGPFDANGGSGGKSAISGGVKMTGGMRIQ